MQALPCEYGGTLNKGDCDIVDASATRLCNDYGKWEKPDVSKCISQVTEMLCDIRNVRSHTPAYIMLNKY